MKGKVGGAMTMHFEKIESKAKIIPTAKDGDDCPFCKQGKLVLRCGKFGDFLGCNKFPKCKGVVKWF